MNINHNNKNKFGTVTNRSKRGSDRPDMYDDEDSYGDYYDAQEDEEELQSEIVK